MQISLLGAVGSLLMLWQIPWPGAPFLKIELSSVPVLIGGFALGPWAGFTVLLVKSLIFAVLKFSQEELVGIPMNIIAVGTTVIVASYIYEKRKTWKNAILALFSGVITSTIVMIPVNYFIVPKFFQWLYPHIPAMSGPQIINVVVSAIIPFNLVFAGVNAVLTFLIYKRVSGFLRPEGEPGITAVSEKTVENEA